MHRFYVPNIDALGTGTPDRSITLDGPIARQLKTVLRVEVGERIRLFDGSGPEWEAEIDDVGKQKLTSHELPGQAQGR